MNEKPTYEELKSVNQMLMEKVRWLEGIYHANKDAGSQVKTRFLSNVSHEIRTPMNAILGFSDLLKSENISENERDEYIEYISLNSNMLLKVVDNIIDFALLETNNLTFSKETVFVDDLLKVIYQKNHIHSIRELRYSAVLLLTLPWMYKRIVVETDGFRLQRILESLVINAMTNQQKGVVELRLRIAEEKEAHITIVSDKNELLEERAKMIFENTVNGNDWYNYLDNTGIAFKLTRDMVRQMGGTVSLNNPDLKRMGITICLPVKMIGMRKDLEMRQEENYTGLLN
ncbi:MAG: HAMP domain-containing histidine kinase [Bacteroidales bacterium]|nr:HAMP domain-containing histidine kinase [Bacteroidales bacterium]